MDTATTDVQSLHFQHRLWKERLAFYRSELKIFQNRLAEVAENYPKGEVAAKLEQLQNQFIRQNEVLDELEHDLKLHDKSLANTVKMGELPGKQIQELHENIHESLEQFEKIYDELKAEAKAFFARNRKNKSN